MYTLQVEADASLDFLLPFSISVFVSGRGPCSVSLNYACVRCTLASSLLNTCCTAWCATSFACQLGSSRLRCSSYVLAYYTFSALFHGPFNHMFSVVVDKFERAVYAQVPEIQGSCCIIYRFSYGFPDVFNVISYTIALRFLEHLRLINFHGAEG